MNYLEESKKFSDKIGYVSEVGETSLAVPRDIRGESNIDSMRVYYISDIHIDNHIQLYCKSKMSAEKYIKNIVSGLLEDMFFANNSAILFGGDIASSFEIAKLFYIEFMSKLLEHLEKQREYQGHLLPLNTVYVYSILGNHELWDFNNKEDCYKAYQELFDNIGIHFLNNSFEILGRYSTIGDYAGRLQNCKNEEELKEGKLYLKHLVSNSVIVGGIGFAGRNKKFNADMGIYRNCVDREEEVEETKKWLECYNKAKNVALENGYRLVVLTHNPIEDWIEFSKISSATYFTGHTHHNSYVALKDEDIFCFSDNQIGYSNKNIKFKKIYLYKRVNPFLNYADGIYEINTEQYLDYYGYLGEKIEGVNKIKGYIKKGTGKFYLIKRNGYLGFFIEKKDGTILICEGGKIKIIKKHSSIIEIYNDFYNMVNLFLNAFSTYRNWQETVSRYLKVIGGTGKIHGFIVDIDIYNHVMLNPYDRTLTFYYSKDFGTIHPFRSLDKLLSSKYNIDNDNMIKILKNHKIALDKLKEFSQKEISIIENKNNLKDILDMAEGKCIKLRISESIYSISMKYNQIQRLFDYKLLRDWNENITMQNGFLMLKEAEI